MDGCWCGLVSVNPAGTNFLLFGRGGAAVDPVVWSAVGLVKLPRFEAAVRDLAVLLGLPSLWDGAWQNWPMFGATAADLAFWLFSVGNLLMLVWFCTQTHWLAEVVDLGVGGVSCVELVIMHELAYQERLRQGKDSFASPCGSAYVCVCAPVGSRRWHGHLAHLQVHGFHVACFGRFAWCVGKVFPLYHWCQP